MRKRLLTQILPLVALAIAALTAVAVTAASRSQRDAVYDQMSQLIGKEANRFDAQASADFTVTHDLAASLEADTAPDRARTYTTFNHFTERHPSLLGAWAAFEPNAYDGHDSEYRNTAHGDRTGRFSVWSER